MEIGASIFFTDYSMEPTALAVAEFERELIRARTGEGRAREPCAAGKNLIKLNVAIICLAPEVTAEERSRAQKAHVLPALLRRRGDIKFY
jgi:hypothetical protein